MIDTNSASPVLADFVSHCVERKAGVLGAQHSTAKMTSSRQGHESAITWARSGQRFFNFAWRIDEPRRCGRIAGCRASQTYPRACVPGYSAACLIGEAVAALVR
jgi:hypothetical protein